MMMFAMMMFVRVAIVVAIGMFAFVARRV